MTQFKAQPQHAFCTGQLLRTPLLNCRNIFNQVLELPVLTAIAESTQRTALPESVCLISLYH